MELTRASFVLALILTVAAVATGQVPWVQHPGNPVLGPGAPGAWDDGGRWAGPVVWDGSQYHMWYSGGHVVGTGEHSDIGHVVSDDGASWLITPDPATPVLCCGEAGAWDDDWLMPGAVVLDGDTYRMWYAAGDGDRGAGGYATSSDGVVWTKYAGNPVIWAGPPGAWDDSGAAPDTVIFDGSTYHMWYTGYTAATNLQIGYASSADGLHWTKHPVPVLTPQGLGWESVDVGAASVVFDGALFHMWYMGVGASNVWIGYAWSVDGITWERYPFNPLWPAHSPTVMFDGCTTHLWYSGAEDIRYAWSHGAWVFRADIQFCDGFESGDTGGWSASLP